MEHSVDRLRRVASRQNNLVKEFRRALHGGELTEEGICAVDSPHLVEEALRSGLKVRSIIFSDSGATHAAKLLAQIPARTEAILVSDEIFSSLTTTDTPQGVAAFVQVKRYSFDDLFDRDPVLLVGASGIQDPGNLGTIIRSGEAFGAHGVVLGERTANPWNPKALRASAGSSFRLPIVPMKSDADWQKVRERGVRVVGTSSHKGHPVHEIDLRKPTLLLIGSEGAGLPRALEAACDEFVTIPHSAKVESLNAAIAASILLYEASRQRKS